MVAGKGKKRENKRSRGEEFFGGERKEGRDGGVLERKEETERGGNGSGERLDCLREEEAQKNLLERSRYRYSHFLKPSLYIYIYIYIYVAIFFFRVFLGII